jgi:Ras-related protein Rab-6A
MLRSSDYQKSDQKNTGQLPLFKSPIVGRPFTHGHMINIRSVVIGNSAVGKTSIINRYIYDLSPADQQPTVGIDFFARTVRMAKRTVRLQIWDTAGQEKFHALIPSYLREANVAILAYDITSRESFDSLDKWHVFTLDHANPVFFVVGNKADLAESRVVATSEGKEWADAHSAQFFELSAFSAVSVNELMQAVLEVSPQKEGEKPDAAAPTAEPPKVEISGTQQSQTGAGCC